MVAVIDMQTSTPQYPRFACETVEVVLLVCAQCKQPIERLQGIKWLDEVYCLTCGYDGSAVKKKIIAWIDEQIETPHGYDLLKIIPKLPRPYEPCPVCGKPSLPVQTPPFAYRHKFDYSARNDELVTRNTYLHFYGSKKILNRLKSPYEADCIQTNPNRGLGYDVEDQIFMYGKKEITILVCEFSLELTGKKARLLTNPTQCPKCHEIGEQADIEKGRGVYRYIVHYNDVGNVKKRCYIQTVKSGKTPTQKCPKCGEFGRPFKNKKSYWYFLHYDRKTKKQTRHYIGTKLQ